MSAVDDLSARILHEGLDDWVPFGMADAFAWRIVTEPSERKDMVIASIRSLAETGLIEIGELHDGRESSSQAGFVTWPEALDDNLDRISAAYSPESEDDAGWYWVCWLNNTPAGDSVARGASA